MGLFFVAFEPLFYADRDLGDAGVLVRIASDGNEMIATGHASRLVRRGLGRLGFDDCAKKFALLRLATLLSFATHHRVTAEVYFVF